MGASWATRDEPARVFAEVFYRQFLQDATLGEAVRQARLYVREHFPGDPTWLAFVVYGHPSARCREPRGSLPADVPRLPPPIVSAPASRPWPALKKPYLVATALIALVVLLAGLVTSPIFDPSESEILVRVSDSDSFPIQGAEVILFAQGGLSKAVTGSHGAAHLKVTPRGRLVVQSPDFKIYEESLEGLPEDHLEVKLRPREADFGKVLFRIVDAMSGQGVARAEVLMFQGAANYQKTSDSNGVVGFDVGFENGTAEVRITVNALDHDFEDHRLTLRPDTSQDVVLDRRNWTLDLSPFGSFDTATP